MPDKEPIDPPKKKKKTDRTKYYASLLYPESATEGWEEILIQTHIPAFLSPLHDSDKNSDGSPKKPHYHLLLMFDGLKSMAQARAIFEQLGGVGCEAVDSLRGMARYLCHLDNPEKAQYEPAAVRSFGDVDYFKIIASASSKYTAAKEIIFWCAENQVTSYRQLMLYCTTEREDWFRALIDSTSLSMNVMQFMKSMAWEASKNG